MKTYKTSHLKDKSLEFQVGLIETLLFALTHWSAYFQTAPITTILTTNDLFLSAKSFALDDGIPLNIRKSL